MELILIPRVLPLLGVQPVSKAMGLAFEADSYLLVEGVRVIQESVDCFLDVIIE